MFTNCPIKDLLAVSTVRRSKAVTRRLVTTKESTRRPLPVCFLTFLCHHQAAVSAFNHFSINFPMLDDLLPQLHPANTPRPVWFGWRGLHCTSPRTIVLLWWFKWCCVVIGKHFGGVFGVAVAVAVYWGVTGAQARWCPAGLWIRQHRARVGLLMI